MIPNFPVQKLTQTEKKFQREILERMVAYITAAFGLVAGLAWNEAIQALIQYLVPLGTRTLWAKLTYAVLVTVIVTFVTIYFTRLIAKKEEQEEAINSSGNESHQ